MKKHKHNVVAIHESEEGDWFAFDVDSSEDDDRVATGATEDIAISNWWALHGSLDEKHPRKGWEGYVGT